MPNVPLGYYSAGASAGYDPQLGMYVAGRSPDVPLRPRIPDMEANEAAMGWYTQEGVGAQY